MNERLKRLLPSRESIAANRWLRWLGPTLLHRSLWHMSRRGVALGAAIGVFFAFITPIAQIPLSAALSVMLRANIPTAIAATLVNTPPTFGPVYHAAWRVSSWMLGDEADDAQAPPACARGGVRRRPPGRPRPRRHQAGSATGTPCRTSANRCCCGRWFLRWCFRPAPMRW